MCEIVQPAGYSQDIPCHEGLYAETPYTDELIPQGDQECLERQQAFQAELTKLLTGNVSREEWHRAAQMVQYARTLFTYLAKDSSKYYDEVEKTFTGLVQEVSIPEEMPFTYMKGEAEEKGPSDTVTILTANLLGMPGDYTWFFGGTSHIDQRIAPLSEKIKEVDADVVCLQEIHEVDSGKAFYEALKGQYAHFYFNIGQGDYTKDPDAIVMNSGLMIASKYPIEDARFIPFRQEGRQMGINKGFFFGTVKMEDGSSLGIVNTHLDPDSEEVREKQVVQISQEMEGTSYLLNGDMNIKLATSEWKGSSLSKNFTTAYLPGEGDTCTDVLRNIVTTPRCDRKPTQDEGYICDYTAIPNGQEGTLKSHKVPLYDLDKPECALSDHQGVFSSYKRS